MSMLLISDWNSVDSMKGTTLFDDSTPGEDFMKQDKSVWGSTELTGVTCCCFDASSLEYIKLQEN